MKKTGIILFLSAACLTGCNTATTEDSTPVPIEKESIEDTTNGNSSNLSSQDSTAKPNITYKIGKETFTKEVHTTEGEAIPYKINLTDDFYLTSEEPGADIVIYKANEAIMMRIESFDANSMTVDQFDMDTVELLTAYTNHSPFTPYNLPPNFSTFEHAKGFIIENESDKLIIVTFAQGDNFIRLTIFDDYITDVSNAFLTIGASIQIDH